MDRFGSRVGRALVGGNMNKDELDALVRVIDYMYYDELRDYLDQDDEGRENHILNDLRILRDYSENN